MRWRRSRGSRKVRHRVSSVRAGALVVLVFALAAMWGCTVFEKPIAVFYVSITEGTAPLRVQFDASESADPDGRIFQFRWSFGDGANAMGETTTHVYTRSGTFNVVLEVVDDDGQTARTTATVNVEAAPLGERSQLMQGDYVLFDDGSGRDAWVGEVLWVRTEYVRVRVMVETQSEEAWEMDCPLTSLIKLTAEKVEEIDRIPDDYYERNDYGVLGLENTLEGLQTFLENFRFEHKYLGEYHDPNLGSYLGDDEFEVHEVFEAPQMAAALECALEDAGFDTRIVVGPSPTPGSSGLHTWVIVVLPNMVIAVEPTEATLQPQWHDAMIISGEITLCPYYTNPDNEIFGGIYTAVVRHSVEMFDWWPEEDDDD